MEDRRDYKKTVGRGSKPLLAIAREISPKPSRGPKSINDYSKMTPVDVSGVKQIGTSFLGWDRKKT